FDCPTALLICQDRTACWVRKYDGKPSGDIDAAIVTTHMMLEAASLGVGCCWVMHFNPAAVREEFALPDNLEPVAILTLGYPAEDAAPYPAHSQRKTVEELVEVL
ncbi:MAG: nitroreductase family protein, partial [Aristaeellaceae bacterium]